MGMLFGAWRSLICGVRPAVAPLPADPSGLTASTNYDVGGRVDLAWNDNSSDETGFIVSQSIDNDSYTDIHTTAAGVTSYAVTGLTNDTLFYFKVRATNASGSSNNTAAASATPRIHPSDIGTVGIMLEPRNTISNIAGEADQWNDSSGGNRHVTAPAAGNRPTITASDAEIGNVRSLTGTGSTRYMTTANHANLNPNGTDEFCLIVLAKLTSTANRILAGKDDFNSSITGYFLQFNQTSANRMDWVTRQAGSSTVLTANAISTHDWHTIAGVRRRVAGPANQLELFVDNVSKGTTNEAADRNVSSTSDFKIFTADRLYNFSHDGKFALCYMIKAAPSAAQLTSLYNRIQAMCPYTVT